MLHRLWSYLKGYAIIKVKGRGVEKFINLAAERGISLWDIRTVQDRFVMARIARTHLRELGPILHATRCRVEVDSMGGLLFFWIKVSKRALLLVGAVGFCVSLYLLSSFVWFIELEGLTRIAPREVMRVIYGAGVRPGSPKVRVDLDKLEQRLAAEFPEIAWTGAQLQGTILRIKVVEKTPIPRRSGVYHTVARCDGVVTSIVPFTGEPLVREGETVSKGQLLIKGYLKRPPPKDREGLAPTDIVDGRGMVLARVWYEAEGEARLESVTQTLTGRKAKVYLLELGKRRFQLGRALPEFEAWRTEERRLPLRLGGLLKKGVQLREVTYHEVETSVVRMSAEEAKALARKRAKDALDRMLQEGLSQRRDILNVREEITRTQDGRIRVAIIAEALEDIGLRKEVSLNGPSMDTSGRR